MRIGIDAHILGKGKGGVERVLHHLVRLVPGLMPEAEFIVYVNRGYTPDFPERPNVRFHRLAVADPLVQRSVLLPWLARRDRLNLLHVQRAAPPLVRSRLVVHAHDLLPLTAPADHAGFRDSLVRRLTPGALRRADSILTVSQTVAEEIRTLFPETAGKLTAILNGVEMGYFRPKAPGADRQDVHHRYGLDGDYILYVGALMARKNLEVAIRGFGSFLRSRGPEAAPVKLVLAGMSRSAPYQNRLKALAQETARSAIVFTGFVPDDECLALLQHASLFLAPSRGEGFDLPALEAMACGIPVVASDLPVHGELLGNDAMTFATDDAAQLAECLWALMGSPGQREALRKRGLQRAARYTWTAAAEQLAAFYRTQLIQPARN